MNAPKRHHFVPEMLQKNFVNDTGGLWTYDSRNPGKGVWSSNPDNLLLEGHLYSHVEPDGTKDASLERWFSNLEGITAPVVEKILSRVRAGRSIELSASEREVWDLFLYQQWRRVPDLLPTLMTREQHRSETEKLLDEFHQTIRPLGDKERSHLLDPIALKRAYQNLRVATLKTGSGNVLSVIARRGIAVAHIPNPKKSFILGSRPVVKLTPPDITELSDPRVELWLPVATDVMIGLGSPEQRELVVAISDKHVRELNESVARQSSQIVGRSKDLIASLSPLVGTRLSGSPLLSKQQ